MLIRGSYAKKLPQLRSAANRCLNGGDVGFFIFIASKARLASSPPAAIASVSTRGVICQGEPPTVLAPTALTFLATIADYRVPVTVCLFLSVCRDLKRKGLAVSELRTPLRPSRERPVR